MKIFNSAPEMQAFSLGQKQKGRKIGFVPTMGYLHEGHLSLVKRAKEQSDIVIVSIFVNPTQFGPNEDYTKYPRDEEKDKSLLEGLGVDALFLPTPEAVYPSGFQTYVEVEEITKKQEGEYRPTHFRGVTTIVSILFNITMPDVAVFGQKDAQQAEVIKRMVKDLRFPIKIDVAPIVREFDGLAKSSRNVYLSEKERQDALVLSRSLQQAEDMIKAGEKRTSVIIGKINETLASVDSSRPDYVRIVEAASFQESEELQDGKSYYILIACRIGKTRLIDNLYLEL